MIHLGGLSFRSFTSGAPASAGAPPIVLVHGIGMSHRSHARLHARLAQTSEVHSIDLPGFAGLPKPGVPLDIPAMAQAIAALLEHLAVKQAVLVGHSMGAQWVVELAAQRPDLVEAVVLLGPVVDDRARTLPAQMLALALDTFRETPRVNGIVFSDYLRCGVRWYLNQVRPMLAYAIEERIADLTQPVLVLRGGRDPIADLAWCRRLSRRARAGSLVIVPGFGHVVQFTAAAAVNSAIVAFLDPFRGERAA